MPVCIPYDVIAPHGFDDMETPVPNAMLQLQKRRVVNRRPWNRTDANKEPAFRVLLRPTTCIAASQLEQEIIDDFLQLDRDLFLDNPLPKELCFDVRADFVQAWCVERVLDAHQHKQKLRSELAALQDVAEADNALAVLSHCQAALLARRRPDGGCACKARTGEVDVRLHDDDQVILQYVQYALASVAKRAERAGRIVVV